MRGTTWTSHKPQGSEVLQGESRCPPCIEDPRAKSPATHGPHRRARPSSRKVLSPSSQDLERSVVMANK